MAELIIAKQGGSVTDAEKDLAFTSNRACSIELLNNTVNITTDGSGYGTANITHGLGYSPTFPLITLYCILPALCYIELVTPYTQVVADVLFLLPL